MNTQDLAARIVRLFPDRKVEIKADPIDGHDAVLIDGFIWIRKEDRPVRSITGIKHFPHWIVEEEFTLRGGRAHPDETDWREIGATRAAHGAVEIAVVHAVTHEVRQRLDAEAEATFAQQVTEEA